MLKENFKNLYNKYRLSIIKSVSVKSLIVAGVVLSIMSTMTWLLSISTIWINIIISLCAFIISFGIFYIFERPTEKSFAKKLDELGLKERAITMYEYKDQDSLMARIQRQNAVDHINKIDKKKLKVAVPVFIFIISIISTLIGIGSTTVCVLAKENVIPEGGKIIEIIDPTLKNVFEITYDVKGDGYIEGEEFQVVEEGEDGTVVEAIAEDGFAFYCWSDFSDDPIRQEKNVTGNIEVTAYFIELEDSGDPQPGDGDGDGQPSDQEQQGKPQDGSSGQGQGSGEQGNTPGGTDGGGTYEPSNQVVDGETYYGDSTYNNAYNDAMENMQSNDNMSGDEKGAVSDYFDNIQK